MKPSTFAIIGAAAWRAQFFLTVGRALSERFQATGLLVRDPAKAQQQQTLWNVPATQALDELLAADPNFVVVSVSRSAAAEYIEELAVRRGIPVLCETPPAPADVTAMNRLYITAAPAIARGVQVQVAENYPFQPMHAARIALPIVQHYDDHAAGFERSNLRAVVFLPIPEVTDHPYIAACRYPPRRREYRHRYHHPACRRSCCR